MSDKDSQSPASGDESTVKKLDPKVSVRSPSVEEVLEAMVDANSANSQSIINSLRDGLQDDAKKDSDDVTGEATFTEIVSDQLPIFDEYKSEFTYVGPAEPKIFRDPLEPSMTGIGRNAPDLDAFGQKINSSEFLYAIIVKGLTHGSKLTIPVAFEEIWLVRSEDNPSLGRAQKFTTWIIDPRRSTPKWLNNLSPTSNRRVFQRVVDIFVGVPDSTREDPFAFTTPESKSAGNANRLSMQSGNASGNTGGNSNFGFAQSNPRFGSSPQMPNNNFNENMFHSAAFIPDPSGGNCRQESTPFEPNQFTSPPANSGSAGMFGSMSANPDHAKLFRNKNPTPNASISPENAQNNLSPDPMAPEMLFAGCNSVEDCIRKMKLESGAPRHTPQSQRTSSTQDRGSPFGGQSSPGEHDQSRNANHPGVEASGPGRDNHRAHQTPHWHTGLNESPKSCWQDSLGNWYAIVADVTKSGQRGEISPTINYSKESEMSALLVPESDSCCFGRVTKMRTVYLDGQYSPLGSIFAHLSRQDLIKLYTSADDVEQWSRSFYFIEQLLPRPPRAVNELLQLKFEGRATEPWLALVLSSNVFPLEFIQKLKSLVCHFSDRSKRLGESLDDQRYIDYTFRRAEKARSYVGSANDSWLNRKAWQRFASTAQSNPNGLRAQMIVDCFPGNFKAHQATENLKTVTYLLGLCPWSRTEAIGRAVRAACSPPFGPTNCLIAFTEVLKQFIDLNPTLDASCIPKNSRGCPLAMSIQLLRPGEQNNAMMDFCMFCSTQLLVKCGTTKVKYVDALKHSEKSKEQKKNAKSIGKKIDFTRDDDDIIVDGEDDDEPDLSFDDAQPSQANGSPKDSKKKQKKKKNRRRTKNKKTGDDAKKQIPEKGKK